MIRRCQHRVLDQQPIQQPAFLHIELPPSPPRSASACSRLKFDTSMVTYGSHPFSKFQDSIIINFFPHQQRRLPEDSLPPRAQLIISNVGYRRTRLPPRAQLNLSNVGYRRTRLPPRAQLHISNVGYRRTRLPPRARLIAANTTTSLISYSDFGTCRMLSPTPAVRTIAYLIGTPTPQRLLSARQPLAPLLSIRASFICLEYSRIEPRGGS